MRDAARHVPLVVAVLLFTSDRTGSAQLYRAEIASGRLVQLTADPEVSAATACPDPREPRRVYLRSGAEVRALDIVDFTTRRIGTIPPPCVGGCQPLTLSGDGRLLATGLRDTIRVHPHPSFDRLGRFVQFHSGRTHATVALIDLRRAPPTR